MVNNSLFGVVGFFGLMFSIFMIIKLIGVINWSLWWDTPPTPTVMPAHQPMVFEDEHECKLK